MGNLGVEDAIVPIDVLLNFSNYAGSQVRFADYLLK